MADVSSDSDVSDQEYESWVEVDNGLDMPATCLFCPHTSPSVEELWTHSTDSHNFSVGDLIRKHSLDNFGYIKMVNFVRKNGTGVAELMGVDSVAWGDDEYLKPILEDDALLTFDPESISEPNGDAGGGDVRMEAARNGEPSPEEIIRGKDMLIGNLLRDIGMMRATFQSVVLGESEEVPDAKKERERKEQGAWDDGYFSAYGHHSIHQEMLQDRVRTGCYRDAIVKNTSSIKGKKVLDLGCGTGILSMFCVQAGASQVIGVDNAEVIVNTYDIIRENGMDKQIRLIRGAIEDLEDDEGLKNVDVLVSEWMGYFLLFEGMLKSVIHAREKHLRPGGLILPSKCDLYLVPVSDLKQFDKNVNMWDDVYGFKMSSMKTDYLKEVSVELVDPDAIVAEPALLKSFDLMTCQPSDLTVEASFEFVIKRQCEITCLAGYFDAIFDLPEKIVLPTGPSSEPTHWKQAIFYLRKPMRVEEGERVAGVMTFAPRAEDRRAYSVAIRMKDLVLKKVIH